MNNQKFILGLTFAGLMGGAVAIGAYKLLDLDQKNTYQTVQSNLNPTFSNYQNGSSINFIEAANLSRPTVVHIKTYRAVQQYQNPYYDDFFRQFFGSPQMIPQQPQQQGKAQQQQAGSGSGVIISQDGYIVTNNHVIDQADKIEIVLDDKRRYEATLIGTDPSTDLAVLKIKEDKLPAIKFGNSDDLQIGEWVLAVGNPFDLTSTVTAGIVSAKARSINILRGKNNLAIESFIQTDAAVNPGNSGGALVNTKGELVGINTAIATPTGTFAGYSFAVPTTLVKKVVNDLIEFGQVQRALLGISIADVTAELAEEKKIKAGEGVYIAGVKEGAAASEGELKEGDVITKINGIEVNSSSELQEVVGRYRPGDEITVSYKRGEKEKNTKITLKNKLNTTKVVRKEDKAILHVFGADLQEISDDEKSKYDVENGVKVLKAGEGKLKQTGVKDGFIITHINNKSVSTPEELEHHLNNTTRGLLLEGVYPNGQRVLYALGL